MRGEQQTPDVQSGSSEKTESRCEYGPLGGTRFMKERAWIAPQSAGPVMDVSVEPRDSNGCQIAGPSKVETASAGQFSISRTIGGSSDTPRTD